MGKPSGFKGGGSLQGYREQWEDLLSEDIYCHYFFTKRWDVRPLTYLLKVGYINIHSKVGQYSVMHIFTLQMKSEQENISSHRLSILMQVPSLHVNSFSSHGVRTTHWRKFFSDVHCTSLSKRN